MFYGEMAIQIGQARLHEVFTLVFVAMLVAAEDRRYRQHPGVDPVALGRAVFQWVRAGRVVSGGSTLSMQAARLLELHPWPGNLRELHNAIAYSSERIEVWFARGLSGGDAALDDGEFLDVFAASLDELAQWAREGRVTDAKTLVGLLWLQQLRAGAWTLDSASSSSPTRSMAPAAFWTSPQVSPSAPTAPAAITDRKANWKRAPQLISPCMAL